MPIHLRSGTIIDDEVVLSDGELDRVYQPAFMSRDRKDEIDEALRACGEKYDAYTSLRGRRGRAPTKRERREALDAVIRSQCDAISLAIEGTADTTPRAGDLLFDGYQANRVTDEQIDGLFTDLFITAGSDEESGGPS